MPYKNPEDRKNYVLRNRDKRNQQSKDWYNALDDKTAYNRDRYLSYQEAKCENSQSYYRSRGRARHLLKTYNITIDQFNSIFLYQGSCCALCKCLEPVRNRWYVDHDHNGTQVVRGILCLGCNRVLGYLETKPELLAQCSAFKDYVDHPPAQVVLKKYPAPAAYIATPLNCNKTKDLQSCTS